MLYQKASCKLRRAVVAKLVAAAEALRKQERRLLLWDCYRPLAIQKVLWKKVPDPRYVADPKDGSKHNRGAAVDVALVDKAGKPVALPTKFDEFSEAAHRDHGEDERRPLAANRAREPESGAHHSAQCPRR